MRSKALWSSSVSRLHQVREGAVRQAVLLLLLDRQHLDGMCRVAGSSLRLLSTVQPSMSAEDVERDGGGEELAGPAQRGLPAVGTMPRLRGQAEQDAGVVRVVVHDESHVAGLDAVRSRAPSPRSWRP